MGQSTRWGSHPRSPVDRGQQGSCQPPGRWAALRTPRSVPPAWPREAVPIRALPCFLPAPILRAPSQPRRSHVASLGLFPRVY